jgi:CPA1 family monovalent cation:H+ antiporter
MLPLYLSPGVDLPHRATLIFLASGVILLTMVIANFAVPLLAPQKIDALDESEAQSLIDILREVITEVSSEMTDETRRASEEVIRSYNNRIVYIKAHNEVDDAGRDRLRLQALDWQKEFTQDLMNKDEISDPEGLLYLFKLGRLHEHIHAGKHGWLKWIMMSLSELQVQRRALHELRKQEKTHVRKSLHKSQKKLALENYDHVLAKLEALLASSKTSKCSDAPCDVEDISLLIVDYHRRRDRIALGHSSSIKPKTSFDSEFMKQVNEIRAHALQLERDIITRKLDEGELTRRRAKELRDNVAVMELEEGLV